MRIDALLMLCRDAGVTIDLPNFLSKIRVAIRVTQTCALLHFLRACRPPASSPERVVPGLRRTYDNISCKAKETRDRREEERKERLAGLSGMGAFTSV